MGFSSIPDYTPPVWVEMAGKNVASAFDEKMKETAAEIRAGTAKPEDIAAIAYQAKMVHDLFIQLQDITDRMFPSVPGKVIRKSF